MKSLEFKLIIISLAMTCLLTGFFDRFVVSNLLTNEISFGIAYENQDAVFMIKTYDNQGEEKSYGRNLIKKKSETHASYKIPMTYSSKVLFEFGATDGNIKISDIEINNFSVKNSRLIADSFFSVKGLNSVVADDNGSIVLNGHSNDSSFQISGDNLGFAVQDHLCADLLSALLIFVISYLILRKSKLNSAAYNRLIELLLFLSFLSFIVWNNSYIFNSTENDKIQILRLAKFSYAITNNLWIICAFLLLGKIIGLIRISVVKLAMIVLLIPFVIIYIADYFSFQEVNTHIVIFDARQFLDTSADASSIVVHFFAKAKNWVVLSFLISAVYFLCANFARSAKRKDQIKPRNTRYAALEFMLLVISAGLYFLPYNNVDDKYLLDNLVKSNFDSWQASKDFSEDYLKKLNFRYELFESRSRSENQHKNVILLVIESLTFSKSDYFSGIENKMPYLDSLARNNISFMNYHSNGSNSLTGNYSIITSLPFIFNDKSNVLPNFFYDYSLAKVFNNNGYVTRVISAPKLVYGMDIIEKSSGFSYISDDADPFYNGKPRYVFNGVSDDVLYDNVVNYVKREDRNFFYLINTVTTHQPYLNPITKENSFDSTIEYAERSLEKFVNDLSGINFFDDGILVIVGDHRAMIPISPKEYERYGDWINARMPLVIIDKEMKNSVICDHLSNNSLGSIIQYLSLPKVIMSREQGNPFLGIKELVVFNQYARRNEVLVKYGEDFDTVLHLSGDDSYLEKPSDDESFNNRVIGYIAWLRQRVIN